MENEKRFGIELLDGEEILLSTGPSKEFLKWIILLSCILIIGIPLLPLTILIVVVVYNRYRYWVTNRRVIIAIGFIGYEVRSIPLERIADVVYRKSIIELLSGTTSLIIRDMAGEAIHGKSLFGIDDGDSVQKTILEEVRIANYKNDKI